VELESQLRQEGYTEDEARAIVRRALRLQADAGGGMDRSTLEASAAEVGVAPEWIREAAGQVRAERQAAAARRRVLQVVGVGAAVLFALFLWGSYSALNHAQTRVEAARAQLETTLQRRFNLLPNLVKVTREYAAHERAVVDAIAAARSRFQQASTLTEKEAASAQLQTALPRLLAVVESHPQLRSSELYLRLQDELAGTENRIAVDRRRYNQAVADYNRTARSVPMVLMRPLLGFEAQHPYLQAAPEARRPPNL
jgi:LemA protein